MVTTGYISEPAYREAIDGKHKILILTATDIARILRDRGITASGVPAWLDSLTAKYHRMSL